MGLVRTALFNWAFARHNEGTLVFRIEDTDAARDSEESYGQLLDSMRWLGFDWDEGPEVGGPHAPYRQSQRMDIYQDVAAKLLDAGHAYHCYCSTEELDARRDAARAAGKPSGYDGHCRELTAEQKSRVRGRGPHAHRPLPDARRDDHLHGPGPRRDHLTSRRTCRTTASSAPTAPRSTRWSTRSTTP